MAKVNAPKWNGRKIAKEEDAHDLEQRAALYEFKHRMPRGDAEHRAHHEYRQDRHREAAAYHLQGLKAAQHAGSQEEGHKHGLMYQLHMKALGLDPMGPVPHEIKSLADKQDKFYKFKPHRGDVFLLQGDDEGEVKKSLRDDVFKLGQRPFKAGQKVYQTSHTGERFPFVISSPDYKMMRYMDADHPHVHIKPDGWKGSEGWYPLAALHFEQEK